MKKHFSRFEIAMKCYGLAPLTRLSYRSELKLFLIWLGGKDPLSVTVDDVITFLAHLEDKGLAPSTITVKHAAIKMFFVKTLHHEWPKQFKPSRKKRIRLPILFTPDEVAAIINATVNIKQRTIFITLYATGMRSCEARHLKPKDIDSTRMQIRLVAKGGNERIVPLSEPLLQILRQYWRENKENKTQWLFPGGYNGWMNPYSRISIHKAFAESKIRAGVTKPSSVHILRHCYGTHLLESGVDIRVIQLLMGHLHISSTEVYTHLSNRHALTIKNPLDAISGLLLKR